MLRFRRCSCGTWTRHQVWCERAWTKHKVHHHLCCWAWKAALVIPALHLLLHLLGIPHPEMISFLP